MTWSGDIDQGDSIADFSRTWFLIYLIEMFIGKPLPRTAARLPVFASTLSMYTNSNGQLIRSPQGHTDPKDMPRDQVDPYVMNLSLRASRLDNVAGIYVTDQFEILKKNYFRYPNNQDLASPEHIGHYKRHKLFPLKWLYFHFSDLFMLLNSLIICFLYGRTAGNIDNDINHQISLLHAEALYPTWISREAARIYFKYRPTHPFTIDKMPGSYNQPETDAWLASTEPEGWLYALKQYFNPKTGNQDLVEYFQISGEWLKEQVK